MDDNLEQWVTFYRVYHHDLRIWLLVQKRDGCTRTVAEAHYRRLQDDSRNELTPAA